MTAVVWIDGGSRGNPGPAGFGVRVEDLDGELIEQFGGALARATCNQAEYEGLIAALTWAVAHGCRGLLVRSDSLLLVLQMRGRWRVKHPGLQPLYQRARDLVRRVGDVQFTHVPREENFAADALANEAMDAARHEALRIRRDTKSGSLEPGPRTYCGMQSGEAGESPCWTPDVTRRADPPS